MDSGQTMNLGIPLLYKISWIPQIDCNQYSKKRVENNKTDYFAQCLRISLVLYRKRNSSLCRTDVRKIIYSYRDLGSPHTILQLLPDECQQY